MEVRGGDIVSADAARTGISISESQVKELIYDNVKMDVGYAAIISNRRT